MLTAREHNACQSDLVHRSNSLSDYSECVVADLAIGNDVIGSDKIEIIDLFTGHKFADINCAGAFEGNAFEFLLIKFEIAVLADLVALNDVLLGTSLPVSASTLRYLILCPVFLL